MSSGLAAESVRAAEEAMRLIGHLPNEEGARRFSDFLSVEGIGNEVEPDQGRWAVWIHGEDELARAKGFLQEYERNSADPRFKHHARQARLKREQEHQEEQAAARRQIDGRGVFRQGSYRAGAFAIVLIGISSAVALFSNLGSELGSIAPLFISEKLGRHLPEVREGQVWRLLTPIFIHFGIWHLLFNMLWLYDLGGMIERVRGPRHLAWLVAVIGIISNLAQYFHGGPVFGGMSGVVYGLFGYIWMKATFDPWSGLFLHPQTVVMLLLWFFLCLTPWMPLNVANMAHASGLVLGLVWGVISGKLRRG